MLTDNLIKQNNMPVLEFKSGSFSVPALILSGNDLQLIDQQLEEKIKLAPEFFKNSPVVIELKELNKQNLDIDIIDIATLIQKHSLIPIGIRGGTAAQNKAAMELRLPVYTLSSRSSGTAVSQSSIASSKGVQVNTNVNNAPPEKRDAPTAMIISQPIRSGQRVYAHGDLVVLGQVSAGAEILAEGNIHIYGSLRGRALAGVQGNTDARIFCTNLQAELVSIAGNYKISEDLNKTVYNKPVHIYLKDYTLVIKEL